MKRVFLASSSWRISPLTLSLMFSILHSSSKSVRISGGILRSPFSPSVSRSWRGLVPSAPPATKNCIDSWNCFDILITSPGSVSRARCEISCDSLKRSAVGFAPACAWCPCGDPLVDPGFSAFCLLRMGRGRCFPSCSCFLRYFLTALSNVREWRALL